MSPDNRPTILFDGDCGFCRGWIDSWQDKVDKKVVFKPYQDAVDQFTEVSEAEAKESLQLIEPDGSVYSGAAAVFKMLTYGSSNAWWWLYEHVPGFSWVSESVYRLVAGNRGLAAGFMSFLTFGTGGSFVFSSWLFVKILGVVYLIAFASFGVQALGLIGKNGILPVSNYLARIKTTFGDSWILQNPTLFGFNAGDWVIQAVIIAGIIFSILLIIGALPRLSLVALFVLYLSVVNGGQVFMSFQWDVLLLEAGFLAIFLTPSSNVAIWVFWWLLAKVILMSGAVKLMSSGEAWENLQALNYHFLTQPLPNFGGYLMHQLPAWMHKGMTLLVLAVEIGVAVLLGLSRKLRFVGAWLVIGLQVAIALTGNYTFFNLLTAGIAVTAFDDAFWQAVLPDGWVETLTAGVESVGLGWPIGGISGLLTAGWLTGFGWLAVGVCVLYLILSFTQATQMFTRFKPPQFLQNGVQAVKPFHITNTYGLFANMTTTRPEIAIEGSRDGENWQAYKFKYKPNGPQDFPPQVAPHQPRLDWQMWFAALRNRPPAWFPAFAGKLLEGGDAVEGLLAENPFGDNPPQYIRARIRNYEFTDFSAWRKTGDIWQAGNSRIYLPAVSGNE
jgi:predicted DCC family thiol-disulfide oxidoreductase YuxK